MEQAVASKRIGLALLLLLGLGAFWDGLYTPAQQLIAVILASVYALTMRQAVRLTPTEAVASLLLAAGAILSLRDPVAAGTAAHGPVLVAGWMLALVSGRSVSGRPLTMAEPLTSGMVEGGLARFWAVLGTLMAFGGMLAISFTPVHHSGRLASFLGYPIAVGMLGLLGLAGTLPDLAAGKRWAGLLALGNMLGLLLSGSRWVWLTALLLTAYLAWAAPGLLRQAWPKALPALATALAAALWAAPAVSQRSLLPLVTILLVAIWTIFLLETFHHLLLVRVGGLLGLAFALALAPGWSWLLGRASALPLTEGSSVERFTFLRDGIRLVAELPLGAGYRSWTALHLQAASYGYYSAEVHSALLDLAIGFGWAGGVAFLILLGRFLLNLRRGREWDSARLVVLAGLGALGVHALLDWDLSYALFAFPLWFGFGLAGPAAGDGLAGGDGLRWPTWLTKTLASLTLAACAVVGAGDLFTTWAETRLNRADPASALRHAEAAVAIAPWNDAAHVYRAESLVQRGNLDGAVAAMELARQLSPREPWYAQQLAQMLTSQGRWREAGLQWRASVALWPWQVEVYEMALRGHFDLIRRARAAGEVELAEELTGGVREILAKLDAQKAKEPPGAPRKPMQTDTAIIREAREMVEGPGPL